MEGKGYETKVAVIYMQYSLAVNRPLVIHYIQQHPLAKYAFKCYESIFSALSHRLVVYALAIIAKHA